MRILGLVLVALLGLSAAPGPAPGAQGCGGPVAGFLGGYARVGLGCSSVAPPPEPGQGASQEEIAARWAAYLDSLFEACIASFPDPALARCDAIAVDLRATPPGEASPVITINDLAQFRPIVGELVVEPDGWGVVGTPTNFYATAETHTMPGELFDTPIQVRWTPTSYVFDYGDGTVQTSEASGTAWRGTEESWTETATSHAYVARDDVTASLTVVFTAEVDAGGGWFAVPGTLPVDAPSVGVKVFEVDTVLTNGDCMANPSAAGCG